MRNLGGIASVFEPAALSFFWRLWISRVCFMYAEMNGAAEDRMANCLKVLAGHSDGSSALQHVWLQSCRHSFAGLIADKFTRSATETKKEVRSVFSCKIAAYVAKTEKFKSGLRLVSSSSWSLFWAVVGACLCLPVSQNFWSQQGKENMMPCFGAWLVWRLVWGNWWSTNFLVKFDGYVPLGYLSIHFNRTMFKVSVQNRLAINAIFARNCTLKVASLFSWRISIHGCCILRSAISEK